MGSVAGYTTPFLDRNVVLLVFTSLADGEAPADVTTAFRVERVVETDFGGVHHEICRFYTKYTGVDLMSRFLLPGMQLSMEEARKQCINFDKDEGWIGGCAIFVDYATVTTEIHPYPFEDPSRMEASSTSWGRRAAFGIVDRSADWAQSFSDRLDLSDKTPTIDSNTHLGKLTPRQHARWKEGVSCSPIAVRTPLTLGEQCIL